VRTASLSITSNGVNSPAAIPLTGTGLAPQASVSPTDAAFGSVFTGDASSAATVSITNIGNETLNVSSVTLGGANPGDFSTTAAASYTIAPSASESFDVTFTPAAGGARSASISIVSDDPASPATVQLTGTGVVPAPPTADVSPVAIDFGTVTEDTTSAPQGVTITNAGDQTLEVSGVSVSGEFGSDAAAAYSIAPGDSVNFNVTFSPTSEGAKAGQVDITSNDPAGVASVLLAGQGQAVQPPAASLSPGAHDFGTVLMPQSGTPVAVTLSNVGDQTLEVSSVGISGTHAGDFGTDALGAYSIEPGNSVGFNLTFTPTAAGARTASLSVVSNDPASPAIMALSGTGEAPPKATVTPSSHNFGSEFQDDTTPAQTFTVENTDFVAHDLTNVYLDGADTGEFVLSGLPTFPVAMDPSDTATADVAFAPTAIGSFTADVVFEFDNGAHTVAASLQGTGSDPAPMAFYRLNAGGSAYTDPNGNLWERDGTYVNTGSSSVTSADIAGTELVPIFQSERWDNPTGEEMHYTLPLPAGDYTVRLYFAEIYSGASEPGQRVFDVTLEGQVWLQDFDIAATVGYRTATIQQTNVTVTDGALNIEFLHNIENPKVNGIEVLGQVADAPVLNASPSSIDFGQVEEGVQSAAETVTLTNTGTATLDVTGILITNPTGGTFNTTAAPPYSIAPSASVNFDVTLTADSIATHTATLSISSNDLASPHTIALTGEGVAFGSPRFGLSPSSVAFGTADVGTQSPAVTVTVTNDDSTSHELHAIGISGDNVNDFLVSNASALPLTLAPGQSASADVSFAPTATGTRSGELRFHFDLHTYHAVAALSGTGQDAPPPPPAGEVLYRINAGGPSYTDTQGNNWLADAYYNTGQTYASSEAIAGTSDDPLYQSERWDPPTGAELMYTLPLANGEYELRLHFAEIFTNVDSPGERVFDVRAEGHIVLDNYDIFAKAGFATAVVESIPVSVSGGALEIEFIHITENPKINAIEVFTSGGLVADKNLIEWGHVGIGAQGDVHNVTLTNTGDVDVTIDSLAFNINQGVGHDFHVTLGSQTYAGGENDVTHTANVAVPVGESVVVPIQFLPTEELTNDVEVVFGGNFAPKTVRLIGTGGNDTGHPFLHVVIVADPYVVDFDGDGSEPVNLVGQFSHTHEIGRVLTTFEWSQGGTIFSTAQDVVQPFNVGEHTVTLTIYDDNEPPEMLSGSETFRVVSPDAIPGVLAQYYTAGGANGANAYLDGVPANPDFAEALPGGFVVQEESGTIGGSPFSTYVMVQLQGTVEIETTGDYAFIATGGNETRVFVDDSLHTGAQTLLPGLYDIDARFAVDFTSELPLNLTYAINGGQPMAIDPLLVSHDESTMTPVINSMPSSGLGVGGATIAIEGMGFVPTDQVTVHWGSTDIAGSDLTVTPTQISFIAPPGQNTISVTVETPNGVSNAKSYTYNADGPAPVDFDISDMITGLGGVTCGVIGQDGRLYVGELDGTIYAFTFDDDYNITDSQTITTMEGLSNPNILGMSVNPLEAPGVVKLYISHNELFAKGGSCFSGSMPYTGQVSALTGPNFDTLEPIATNLPVSNHDHGINGSQFDDNGDLYVLSGSNTNAGIPHCNIGGTDESPLTTALLRLRLSQPDFNGNVVYYDPATCLPDDDQVNGGFVRVAHGVDIDTWAVGVRNPLSLVYTTKSRFYATDNGPNVNFGVSSTGPNSEGTHPSAKDELNYLDVGRYYGSPNRNRGRDDYRENFYRHPDDGTVDGDFVGPATTLSSSSNGIIEYRAQTFNSAMRGEIITQHWNSKPTRIKLTEDGYNIVSKSTLIESGFSVLNLVEAPGGVILGIDYTSQSVMKAVPNDSAAGGLTVYDIHPWRAPKTGGHEFVIGGANFGNLGNTTVTIGGQTATLTSVSNKRIRGIIPSSPSSGPAMHDVVVTVGPSSVVYPNAFRYLHPAGIDTGSKASFIVNPDGDINDSSTFGKGSFKVTNQSTGGQKVTRLRIDISSSLIPDLVFDPDGTAGDTVGKDFTHDSGSVGITSNQWFRPNGNGYEALEITFNDFGPGETLAFSADIDPTNIQGAAPPGPNHSGSISGMELTGAHIRIEFDDGTVREGSLFAQAGSAISTASEVTVFKDAPPEAEMEALGVCSPALMANANQTIRVYGPAGYGVRLIHLESALYLDGVPGGGFDIDPFEHNTAISLDEQTATIGAGGYVDIPVTLTNSGTDAGYNVFSSVLVDGQGYTGPVSQTLVLQLN
jgi:hypothetical protein